MVVPVSEEVGVGPIAHVFHELVDDFRFWRPFDAELFLDAAFNDAEVAGVGDDAELGLLVDAYHVNARFCCGLEGGKS